MLWREKRTRGGEKLLIFIENQLSEPKTIGFPPSLLQLFIEDDEASSRELIVLETSF
jgi:hypothetical protein